MKKIFLAIGITAILLVMSCASTETVDMENLMRGGNIKEYDENRPPELLEDELRAEIHIKENDIAQAVVVIESPELLSVGDNNGDDPKVDIAAVKENMRDKLVYPEYQDGRLRGWIYREGNVYKIITQTYHSTLIRLEPGEELIETPFCSEPDVWRISRGIAYKDGMRQHVIAIKPDYSGQNSSLILVTDRRIYQMEIISTKETYMPTVQWVYSRQQENNGQLASQGKSVRSEMTGVSAELLSFDYTMTHPAQRKPVWCPTMAYDDGLRTYIVLAAGSLLQEFPVMFNEKNEIINYRSNDNVIIIDKLIERVTLRSGSDKVVIEKKIKKQADERSSNQL